MKKLYTMFKTFIEKHSGLTMVILTLMLFILAGMLMNSSTKTITVIDCIFTMLALFRLVIHKIGEIPFFMQDRTKTFIEMEHKGDKEVAEKEYNRTISIIYTVSFIIAVVLFPIAVIVEVLSEFVFISF